MNNINSYKILIVDDTRESIDLLGEVLSDFEKSVATSGEQAIKIATGKNKPDLILLDIMMPEMDGFEVCRVLKANAETKNIPIIFITAKSSVEDEALGLALGAIDFIPKPISPPVVLARVKIHLELLHARARLEKQSEHRYKQLLESITDYTYSVDIVNNRIGKTIHNPGCEKVTGYKGSDFAEDPRLWLHMVHPDDRSTVEHYADPLTEGKEIPPLEHRILHKNESVIWIKSTFVLKHNANGEVIGYDGLISDITERKEFERQLILAKEKAEEMNRLKSSLLANLSHELRTPLIAIMGCSELIQEEHTSEYLQGLAVKINNGGKRLLTTFNKLLQFSKLESEHIRPKITRLNVTALLYKVVQNFRDDIAKKGLQLITEIDPDPFYCYLDETLLREIFTNILSNAYKFTDEGHITICLKRTERFLNFSVIDTGIGISKEHKDIVFNEFRQASEGFGRFYEGTGLGLTIVKRFVNILGGTIELTSELDKGSAFTVHIPLNNCEDGTNQEAEKSI